MEPIIFVTLFFPIQTFKKHSSFTENLFNLIYYEIPRKKALQNLGVNR